jgi:hypothetical protein
MRVNTKMFGNTKKSGNSQVPVSLTKFERYRIRIRIFIIPINGSTIGANKLHTLIIVIGGNYTYKCI